MKTRTNISKFYCYNTKKNAQTHIYGKARAANNIHRWIDLNFVAHVTRRMDMY